MNKIQKIVSMVFLGMSLFTVTPVLAQSSTPVSAAELLPGSVGSQLGLPNQDVRVTVARIIRVAMSLIGIVMVALILFGGFLWMTAGGNEENITKGKQYIISAVIGLAIVLSAFAISTFVINQLVTATSDVAF